LVDILPPRVRAQALDGQRDALAVAVDADDPDLHRLAEPMKRGRFDSPLSGDFRAMDEAIRDADVDEQAV
jgi:hypothetical protein